MKKNIVGLLGFLLFSLVNNAYATIVTYNFSGSLTSVSDRSYLLGPHRDFQVDDSFQAIYSVDTEAPMTSGSTGSGAMTNSSFSTAILNFKFYVENINLVDSSYRFNTFRNINGMINGSPADWIEIIVDGGLDNYNDSYGKSIYGEYIDSELSLVDLTGTALDSYNKNGTGNIPLFFDMNDFSFGNVRIVGESSVDSINFQLRGDVTSFSSEEFKPVQISEPTSLVLLSLGLAALYLLRFFSRYYRLTCLQTSGVD